MKITKHQRKVAQAKERQTAENKYGISVAMQHSLKNGQRIEGTNYIGAVPQFAPVMGDYGQVLGYRKIAKGIPFVRVA